MVEPGRHFCDFSRVLWLRRQPRVQYPRLRLLQAQVPCSRDATHMKLWDGKYCDMSETVPGGPLLLTR